MPESVRRVGNMLPMTHVVKLIQGLWFGGAWSEHVTQLVFLGILLVVGTVVAVRAFRWE